MDVLEFLPVLGGLCGQKARCGQGCQKCLQFLDTFKNRETGLRVADQPLDFRMVLFSEKKQVASLV
jgi:hypothetical protein